MTLSQRAVLGLCREHAAMRYSLAGASNGAYGGGYRLHVTLAETVESLARQTRLTRNSVVNVAVWRLLRDLRAMDREVPAKPADVRGEIARRLGVDA